MDIEQAYRQISREEASGVVFGFIEHGINSNRLPDYYPITKMVEAGFFSRKTFDNLRHAGKLHPVKKHGRWFVSHAEWERYMSAKDT